MTKRFEKAYNALVKAYFEGTLAKGTCVACAVGNIVADAMGATVKHIDVGIYWCDVNNSFWFNLFCTQDGNQTKNFNYGGELGMKLEKLTNYTVNEMAQIEFTFENNTKIYKSRYYKNTEQDILEDQYNGLIAVVDIMLKFDNEINNGHKEKFLEHPKLQKV